MVELDADDDPVPVVSVVVVVVEVPVDVDPSDADVELTLVVFSALLAAMAWPFNFFATLILYVASVVTISTVPLTSPKAT